jgi:hypothetical protein
MKISTTMITHTIIARLSIRKLLVSILLLATFSGMLTSESDACNERKQTLDTKEANNIIFKFENYERSEDAHKKLLSLFPIGSDVTKFTKSMKSIKGTHFVKEPGLIGVQYWIPLSSATSYTWYVEVLFNDNGAITKIDARRNPSAL